MTTRKDESGFHHDPREDMYRAQSAFNEWWADVGTLEFNLTEKNRCRKVFMDGYLMCDGERQ